MRFFNVFSAKQINDFNTAWLWLIRTSATLLVVGLVALFLKFMWTPVVIRTPFGFAPVVSILVGFAVILTAHSIRTRQYRLWFNGLHSYALGWAFLDYPVESELEVRLVKRQFTAALKHDLINLQLVSPKLGSKINKLQSLDENLAYRDVKAMAKELSRHGVRCKTWDLASPQAFRSRDAYIQKALRRLPVDDLVKKMWSNNESEDGLNIVIKKPM